MRFSDEIFAPRFPTETRKKDGRASQPPSGLRPFSELQFPCKDVPGDESAMTAESEKNQKNRVKYFFDFLC
jgi:hypothetical protein